MDCREQLAIWSRLLEGRIALQKVVVASREVEKENTDKQQLDEETVKSVSKLLTSLVKLRDSLRAKGQFNLGEDDCEQLQNNDSYKNIDDKFLDQRHDDYSELRTNIIDKWYEKTKIGTIPKKGYTMLELPTSKLIENALKDKDRLISRTQIDRTEPTDTTAQPEVFNDDDFYHHLLKEVVSKEETSKWVEMQRMRYKTKRKIDAKATKGRKIKKDLVPKLVNFMAPTRPVNERHKEPISDQIRGEMMKSLFGGVRHVGTA